MSMALSRGSASVAVGLLLAVGLAGCLTGEEPTSTDTMVTTTMEDPWQDGETDRVLFEGTVEAGECYPTATVVELVFFESVMGGCAFVPREDVAPIPAGTEVLRIEVDARDALQEGRYAAFLSTTVRDSEDGMGAPTSDPVHAWSFRLEREEWDLPRAVHTEANIGVWTDEQPGSTDVSVLQGPVHVRVIAERDPQWTPSTLNAPYTRYEVPPPDADLPLVSSTHFIPGHDGVELHVRIVRPDSGGPFPVVAHATPYSGLGRNQDLEPYLAAPDIYRDHFERYVEVFAKRGYAYAQVDVRGTGESSGCFNLRGPLELQDTWHVAEWLGTQTWSDGNVGFVGGSYNGGQAVMAAISGNPHVKAVVPGVTSTSWYHSYFMAGVPHSVHSLAGNTNTVLTGIALTPTMNPHYPNYVPRSVEQAECDHVEHNVDHGGMDQSGAYGPWWQERNLRDRVGEIEVPVLQVHGLADWNVKPDHIAPWWNDLESPKVLVATQLGHVWPNHAAEAYGDWWEHTVAFFDTHLQGIGTGVFGEDIAWVHDDSGEWHRSANWPLLPEERDELVLHFDASGSLMQDPPGSGHELGWLGCPRDEENRGAPGLREVEWSVNDCTEVPAEELEIVFETEPFPERSIVSGVPQVRLTLTSEVEHTHLVAVMARLDPDGEAVDERMNYGYLNPTFRHGISNPEAVPTDTPYTVTIDLYPQEDVVEAGERLRVTLASHDDGRTIEAFERGENALAIGPDAENSLLLPLRPAELQGVRLEELVEPVGAHGEEPLSVPGLGAAALVAFLFAALAWRRRT